MHSFASEASEQPIWLDAEVTMNYHRHKLGAFSESDLIPEMLEIRLLSLLGVLVSTLSKLRTTLNAITAIIALLGEENMVSGGFETENLFALGFDHV